MDRKGGLPAWMGRGFPFSRGAKSHLRAKRGTKQAFGAVYRPNATTCW